MSDFCKYFAPSIYVVTICRNVRYWHKADIGLWTANVCL